MGIQPGYQSEADISSSQYARNILIMQIESLLRERKKILCLFGIRKVNM